jgi:hypothetical protein
MIYMLNNITSRCLIAKSIKTHSHVRLHSILRSVSRLGFPRQSVASHLLHLRIQPYHRPTVHIILVWEDMYCSSGRILQYRAERPARRGRVVSVIFDFHGPQK